MQPAYLPWLGYFALMDRVDTFVYLDSVQFDRRSWQQRNRIKTARGAQMLTVPVKKKGLREQRINEVLLDEGPHHINKHITAISRAYAKAPFYGTYSEALFTAMRQPREKLCDLTIACIDAIRTLLGIRCSFVKSSGIGVRGAKAELLANICRALSADAYISPVGSRAYLEASTAFAENNISVAYNEYTHPVYRQLHGAFIPFLSVVDLLFNEGPASLDIIRSGRI